MADDIVRDILSRVVQAVQSNGRFDDVLAAKIEVQVRADWGGDNPYIAHGKEARITERNEKIQAVWDSGNHDVRMLATRFGLSTKQIRRIVGI